MEDDTGSDAEVMLSLIEDVCRVVVELDDANVNSPTRTNVQTSAERSSKARFRFSGIGRAWAWGNGSAKTGAKLNLIPDARRTDKSVGERLKASFLRVVFDLHAA